MRSFHEMASAMSDGESESVSVTGDLKRSPTTDTAFGNLLVGCAARSCCLKRNVPAALLPLRCAQNGLRPAS